jgi:signal transduction histidine kinase
MVVDLTSGDVLVSWAPDDGRSGAIGEESAGRVAENGASPSAESASLVVGAALEALRSRAAAGASWWAPHGGSDGLEFGALIPAGESASTVVVATVPWQEVGAAASRPFRPGMESLFLADVELERYYFHTDSALVGGAVASELRSHGPDFALSFDRIRDLAVTIGASRDVTDHRLALGARKRAVVIVVGLVIVAVGGVLAAEARRLGSRIALARDAAELYAQGRMGHRVPLRGRGELGELGNSLNAMADRLEGEQRRAVESTSFEVLRRARRRFREEVADGRAGLEELGRNLVDPQTPRVVLRGAGRVLARLAGKLGSLGEGILPEEQSPPDAVPGSGEPPAVDPAGVISRCVAEMGAGRSDVHAQLLLPSMLPATGVPVVVLRRVLAAILDNALRAMPDGGVVKVEAVAESDRVSLHIVDTGVGMAAAFVRRELFRAFASGWPDGEGLGLSLHHARNALERFGGTIEVSSREGVGTRVTLRLPLARPV